MNSDTIPALPIVVWKDFIFPYLDRSSWFALVTADASLWRESRNWVPPWPVSGMMSRMNSAVSKVEISDKWLAVGCHNGSISIIHIKLGRINSSSSNNNNDNNNNNNKVRQQREARENNKHNKNHNNDWLKGHRGRILGLKIIENKWLISQSQGEMMVWDLHQIQRILQNRAAFLLHQGGGAAGEGQPQQQQQRRYRPTWEFQHPFRGFRAMEVFPHYPNYILFGHSNGPRQMLGIWKLATEGRSGAAGSGGGQGTEIKPNEAHSISIVNCLSISADHIACGCVDKWIRLYRYSNPNNLTNSYIRCWKAHRRKIIDIEFTPCGNFLVSVSMGSKTSNNNNNMSTATGGGDTTIRLWNFKGDAIFGWHPSHPFSVTTRCLRFIPYHHHQHQNCSSCSRSWLATAGNDSGKIQIWDLTKALITLATTTSRTSAEMLMMPPSFSTGSTINRGVDGMENLFPPPDMLLSSSHEAFGHDNVVSALSVYNNTLVSGGRDRIIRFWSTKGE